MMGLEMVRMYFIILPAGTSGSLCFVNTSGWFFGGGGFFGRRQGGLAGCSVWRVIIYFC